MFDAITPQMIRKAVTGAPLSGASDYDLNPEVKASLPPGRRLRPAAVLCPLVERADGVHVILTRRSDALRHHAGQVAFPGGKLDANDPSLEATALREASEEIGLRPAMVDVLGSIEGHETVTGFNVTPFVGFVDPGFEPVLDASEVAEVFEAPLSFVLDPANLERRHYDRDGARRYFYAMPYGRHFIWGATARMLVTLSERVARVA